MKFKLTGSYIGVCLSLTIFGSLLVLIGPGSSLGKPVAVVTVENRPPWLSNRRCTGLCEIRIIKHQCRSSNRAKALMVRRRKLHLKSKL